MTRSLAIAPRVAAPLVVAALVLAGCGGDGGTAGAGGVDNACDAAGVQEEIEHIVHESALEFGEFQTLTCSGDWTFADARIDSADGASADGAGTQSFVFMRQDDMWVLKAQEIVCGTVVDPSVRPDDAEVPADLWATVCASVVSGE